MGVRPSDWLALIDYADGKLAGKEAAVLQERLRHDTSLRYQMHLIQRALETSDDKTLPPPDDFLPPDTIAAFVQGSLPEAEVAELLSLAQRNPGVLRELVSAWRFVRDQAGTVEREEPPERLIRQVLESLPRGSCREPAWERVASLLHQTVPACSPAPAAPTANSGPRHRRKSASPHYAATMVLVAASVVAILAFGIIRWAFPPQFPGAATKKTPQVAQVPDAPPPAIRYGQLAGDLAELPDNPPGRAASRDPEPALASDTDTGVTTRTDRSLPPAAPPPEPAAYEPPPTLALQWMRLKGLAAAFDTRHQRWCGVLAAGAREACEYVTLTESWAQAAESRIGTMVLGEDTGIRVAWDEPAQVVRVDLLRGRMALRDLPAGRPIVVGMAGEDLRVQADEPESLVAVHLTERGPMVAACRGRILVNGQVLSAGDQWWPGHVPADERTVRGESFQWTERPPGTVRLRQEILDRWLHADDLEAALADALQEPASGVRAVAARWSVALFPETALARTIGSPDPMVREQAWQAVLAAPPQDPRQRRWMTALAAQTGDPVIVRHVTRWIQAYQARRLPPASEIENMIRALNHPSLPIRQLAGMLLQEFFGRNVPYDPAAPPAARLRAAQAWRVLLRQQRNNLPSRLPKRGS